MIDSPAARLVALAIAIAAAALLGWIHRDDLFPGAADKAVSGEEASFIACVAERRSEIEGMHREGLIDEGRAALFLTRAEAMCRDLAGGNNQSPPPR